MKQRQWLCMMPHRYGWGDNQGRDVGALANGLRQLGEKVDFFVLDDRTDIQNPEVQLAKYRDLSDPAWWQKQGQGVLLTTFGTSLMQPFYRAARQAGWEVWARMDCDGIPGPDGLKSKYLTGRIVENIDRRRRRNCDLSGSLAGMLEGALRAAGGLILAGRVRQRLFASYDLIDRMLVETDAALHLFQEYFGKHGRADLASRVCVVAPAIAEAFGLQEEVSKRAVIAVGQWFRCQKNFPLLVKTIIQTNSLDPQLNWIVVGNGAHYVQQRLERSSPSAASKVRFYPHTSPHELADLYASAYLIFYSSRQEGFPNTLCEALCCGASVVAPRGIEAFDFSANKCWGTTYRNSQASAAVFAELDNWQQGQRNAERISQEACALFHRKNVAEKLCALRDEFQKSTE
jgi:glycosyltransferase involved in cell wall biosynthesis